MLNSQTLPVLIKEIFSIDDTFIIPITTDFSFPEDTLFKKDETYIGYRIISKKTCEIYDSDKITGIDALRVNFRLCFLGKDAEELATQVLFWKRIQRINNIFDKYNVEIKHNEITTFSYSIKDKNELSWIVDLSAITDDEEIKNMIKDELKGFRVF